jgi:hypothetical protein
MAAQREGEDEQERVEQSLPPKGLKPRTVPNLHIDSIKMKTRDFR